MCMVKSETKLPDFLAIHDMSWHCPRSDAHYAHFSMAVHGVLKIIVGEKD